MLHVCYSGGGDKWSRPQLAPGCHGDGCFLGYTAGVVVIGVNTCHCVIMLIYMVLFELGRIVSLVYVF